MAFKEKFVYPIYLLSPEKKTKQALIWRINFFPVLLFNFLILAWIKLKLISWRIRMSPGPKAALVTDVPISSIANENQQLIDIPDKDVSSLSNCKKLFL